MTMIRKRIASKLALHTETVRMLTPSELAGVNGGSDTVVGKWTHICSTQTNEFTCCVVKSGGCTATNAYVDCTP
jgi:hypothetical protein